MQSRLTPSVRGVRAGVDGRRAFGIATLAFGAVTLAFPDYYDWLQLHWSAQVGRAFADVAAAAQIAGGAAVIFRRTQKPGAALLAGTYLVLSLLSVPRILAAPRAFYPWGDFFNEFVLAAGAAAAYVRLLRRAPLALDRIARTVLGACATSFMLYQALYLGPTAHLVPTWVPPSQMFWAIATTVLLALVPIALWSNRLPLLATRLLASMLGLFGIVVWIPLLVSDPRNHFDWTETVETFAIAASVWIFADLLAVTKTLRVNAGFRTGTISTEGSTSSSG